MIDGIRERMPFSKMAHKTGRHPKIEHISTVNVDYISVEPTLTDFENQEFVKKILLRFSGEEREIMQLHAQRVSPKIVAQRFGLSPSRVHQIIASMKKELCRDFMELFLT